MVAGLVLPFLFGLGPKGRLAAAENTRQKMMGINEGAGEKTGRAWAGGRPEVKMG